MSMLYLDVLDLDYIIAVVGLNGQMNSKKQGVLKSVRMKELKRCHGIIKGYVHRVKILCRKLFWYQKLEFGNFESIPNNAATHDMVLHV